MPIKSNQIIIYVLFGLPANQILNSFERVKIVYFPYNARILINWKNSSKRIQINIH